MFKKIIPVVFLLFCIAHFAQAQWSISSLNLKHLYDPQSEVDVIVTPTIENDSLHLFVNLQINQGKPTLKDYSFNVYTANGYDEKLNSPLNKNLVDSTLIKSHENAHIIKLSINRPQTSAVVVQVTSAFSSFSFYHPINLEGEYLSNIIFLNSATTPVITSYMKPGTYTTSTNLTGFYYTSAFSPALPPMVTRTDLPSRSLEIDSTFSISKDRAISLDRPGLYYFQQDTSEIGGVGKLVTDRYFPKFTSVEQLTEPLIYITTKSELEQLSEVKDKKGFDQFWLNLTQSQERARRIIRNYYSRVEEANYFFTSFKEGWKTDRGMIYIIYGPPDEVIKGEKQELWVYMADTHLPKLEFTFMKADNVFSSKHYVLIRDRKYDNPWFRAIDRWRKSRF